MNELGPTERSRFEALLTAVWNAPNPNVVLVSVMDASAANREAGGDTRFADAANELDAFVQRHLDARFGRDLGQPILRAEAQAELATARGLKAEVLRAFLNADPMRLAGAREF